MKQYFKFNLLIAIVILSSCEKECKNSDELDFLDGKYYCGKKLFSGTLQKLNSPRTLGHGTLTIQSINNKKVFREGYLIYKEHKGIDGWLNTREYNYYDIKPYGSGIGANLYEERFNKNYIMSYFEFVNPRWLEFGGTVDNFSLPMYKDGNFYISNFPVNTGNGMDYYSVELDETSSNPATSPSGTEMSIVGSLKRSIMYFRDSTVFSKVKYYENKLLESGTSNQNSPSYIEVFKELNGKVILNPDYSNKVTFGWYENVNPEKFITLEYSVLKNDKETIINDSINNTTTITYSNIICRNKILHKCLVLQGDNILDRDRNIKHRDPVSKDIYKKIIENQTYVTPIGQGEDFSTN